MLKRIQNRQLHICHRMCDLSHEVWDKHYPNDPILKGEVIHHKDGDHDNNKKCNLQKMTDSAHKRLHAIGKMHSEETKIKIRKDKKGKIIYI